MFMVIMKILTMVLLVMPRYVCFSAINQHILLFDDVNNIDDDIGDGASGNARQQDFWVLWARNLQILASSSSISYHHHIDTLLIIMINR